MKGRDLFGVILRTVGLLALVLGLWLAAGMLFPINIEPNQYRLGLFYFTPLGIILLFGAGWIVDLSYRGNS